MLRRAYHEIDILEKSVEAKDRQDHPRTPKISHEHQVHVLIVSRPITPDAKFQRLSERDSRFEVLLKPTPDFSFFFPFVFT